MTHHSFSRRQFLIFGGAATLLGMSGASLPALIIPSKPKLSQKKLLLCNPHTGESFDGVFWRNGCWVDSSLEQLNKLLRDRRNGKVHAMNKDLFTLMQRIHEETRSTEPFQIICGYRSPETNLKLVKLKRGVAKNSQHLKGNAIDLRLSGVKLSELRTIASAQKAGGVGYYPRSNFIHIDIRTKPVYWHS